MARAVPIVHGIALNALPEFWRGDGVDGARIASKIQKRFEARSEQAPRDRRRLKSLR